MWIHVFMLPKYYNNSIYYYLTFILFVSSLSSLESKFLKKRDLWVHIKHTHVNTHTYPVCLYLPFICLSIHPSIIYQYINWSKRLTYSFPVTSCSSTYRRQSINMCWVDFNSISEQLPVFLGGFSIPSSCFQYPSKSTDKKASVLSDDICLAVCDLRL
jgi:hypothetical protein